MPFLRIESMRKSNWVYEDGEVASSCLIGLNKRYMRIFPHSAFCRIRHLGVVIVGLIFAVLSFVT
jgi:hypothetical protein